VNDQYFSLEWGLNNTGQSGGKVDADIDAPEAWDITRGDGSVVVGVIDSGIDYNHPDLAGAIWTNPKEAIDGVDNDGNGYVDDVRGWDFYSNDNNPMDDNGHGTHVAGTIAATAANGIGVAGVANAKVMALKFLGADGTGSTSAAIAAVNYATQMKKAGVNIPLTNNSWGAGVGSTELYNAIRANADAGMLFVAAAGNGGSDQVGDNNDVTPNYPANYDVANVVSVAATDRLDNRGSFSNYGAVTVDLAAPGVTIASLAPNGGYVYMDGTSMASPHVAGAAALAFS
jgi:subtilisin family serine protease